MGDAFRTPDGRLVWAYDRPNGSPELAPPPNSIPQHISVWVDFDSRGLWALTREARSYRVLSSSARPVTGAVLAEVQQALANIPDQLGPWPPIVFVTDLLRAGKTTSTRILPWGYVHNAISASIALTLACGLALSTRDLRRSSIRERRRRRGQCPACGYDLRGTAHAVCPECGEPAAVAGSPARQRTG